MEPLRPCGRAARTDGEAVHGGHAAGAPHRIHAHDLEGARRAVAEAYGAAIDAPLLARFAQSLHLDAD